MSGPDSATPLDEAETQRVNPSLEQTQQGGRQTASELWPRLQEVTPGSSVTQPDEQDAYIPLS